MPLIVTVIGFQGATKPETADGMSWSFAVSEDRIIWTCRLPLLQSVEAILDGLATGLPDGSLIQWHSSDYTQTVHTSSVSNGLRYPLMRHPHYANPPTFDTAEEADAWLDALGKEQEVMDSICREAALKAPLGQKINAIKQIRATTGMSLKDAKEWCDVNLPKLWGPNA